ncbi:hypothetical protein [Methylomonas koyamae]|uniref:hypothetical protein n=1 Tax=Methylomonas koyamae TaxID=702114 RepID=UPI002110C51F|nr:hypothetical protein [Methylomonas koyamae]
MHPCIAPDGQRRSNPPVLGAAKREKTPPRNRKASNICEFCSALAIASCAECLEANIRRNTATPIDALRIASYGLNIYSYTQGANVSHIKKLEFGNYTLKFGSEKVLLDLFDEVVMPSFFEMKYIRRLEGKCDYFFLDTKLVKLNSDESNPVIGISGRIVKNTKLKRDQIFRPEGGLIEDKSELETAPSSTFLLILNNHRLILCKEVSGGPTIQNFQSTSEYCLKARHKEFIDELFNKFKEERDLNPNLERITKLSLIEKSPYPSLRITPLSDKESLKTFVSRFDHIDKITITLLSTNSEEINNDDFWSDFRKKGEDINSIAAKVSSRTQKKGSIITVYILKQCLHLSLETLKLS